MMPRIRTPIAQQIGLESMVTKPATKSLFTFSCLCFTGVSQQCTQTAGAATASRICGEVFSAIHANTIPASSVCGK